LLHGLHGTSWQTRQAKRKAQEKKEADEKRRQELESRAKAPFFEREASLASLASPTW
jgi:hypothetical protein